MKQLTQADFNSAPSWAVRLAVDEDGTAFAFSVTDTFISKSHGTHCCGEGFKFKIFGRGYDASNWENSAIDKEVLK